MVIQTTKGGAVFIAKTKSMYIPQCESKDLYITNYILDGGYTLKRQDGSTNYKRYKASLDYSLDSIKLKEVYESVYRNKRFFEKYNGKKYCPYVVNVTFNYSIKEFNRSGNNSYVKVGYDSRTIKYDDCLCFDGDELVGVVVGKNVENPKDLSSISPYFFTENGQYKAKTNIKSVYNVAEIRKKLYMDGFDIDGVHYVRWKRSAGSARVGRCLFIAEPLYKKMHEWEVCGIDIKDGDDVDLAAFESYISLTSSSIIDTMEISSENILVIDDFDSVFTDDVIEVTESHGKLDANDTEATIYNCIWDGQSLMDKSIFPEKYQDKGMLLLRNRFFKSCCFNSNVQQFFDDNGITDVGQLNGYTRAGSVSDIKMITTPSSIKFLKFGTMDEWFDRLDERFAIVKYEKPARFFDGRMTQCHYQLINSIQMSEDEVNEFLQPTLDFMELVRTNPAVLRRWIKFDIDQSDDITPLESKNDVIYKLMSVNNRFKDTKLYYDFMTDFLKSQTKSAKCGHILINGIYTTLCGNPISMLKSAIGKFDGTSEFEPGTVCAKRFDYGKKVLASRSPHITMSNVLVAKNARNDDVDKYMNGTDGIIYINSINENIMQKLAGCDFDSDTVLLTDNDVLIRAAERNDGVFKVAVYAVGGKKTARKYKPEDLADLDIKTSRNLIGEIINMSQILNTEIWDRMSRGASIDEVGDIYVDICKLSILSNIEIDKAKREFVIDSAKELKDIRVKYKLEDSDGKQVLPYFFKHIASLKGYYNPVRKSYKRHNTSMDFLQHDINSFRARRGGAKKNEFIELSDMLNMDLYDRTKVNYKQVRKVFAVVDDMSTKMSAIYCDDAMDSVIKHELSDSIRQECVECIGKMSMNESTMIALLKAIERPENRATKKVVTYILFGYPNTSFFDVLHKSTEKIHEIVPCDSGEIDVYGVKFHEIS